MKIKAILYDLDGVLVDAVKIHFDAFNMALLEISGYSISKRDENLFDGLPTRKKLQKLSNMKAVDESDHDAIWKKKQELTKKSIRKNLEYDMGKIELHKWSRGQKIRSVCVTNSITETAELMLECSGQLQFMEFVISNQMTNHCKPSSEPYVRAMVKLNVLPDECIIFEDSDVGYTSAKNTGAHVCRVRDASEVTLDALHNFMKDIGENNV